MNVPTLGRLRRALTETQPYTIYGKVGQVVGLVIQRAPFSAAPVEAGIVLEGEKREILQVAVGMMFVTGLIMFSGQLFTMTEAWLGRDWLFPHGLELIFWTALVIVTLAPLVAIWRNISAMSMLYAEVSTKGREHAKRLRPFGLAGSLRRILRAPVPHAR